MTYEPHKWVYDRDGLAFVLAKDGLFTNIRELKFHDPLAEEPFTHNRPLEDLCMLAVRAN